jgi:hypothetical protein
MSGSLFGRALFWRARFLKGVEYRTGQDRIIRRFVDAVS